MLNEEEELEPTSRFAMRWKKSAESNIQYKAERRA
tara:strand:- start:399 stop:503 length:105 start_codon:yes stop_codon:yes gene_type:complete